MASENINKNFLEEIHDFFPMERQDINAYSPLTLAYLGDAVYEIIIRTLIVEERPRTVKTLHKHASRLVNAKAQAALMISIEHALTQEEVAIYKRGRNAKSHSVAKNADIHDYRIATGLEALIGYLYLTGNTKRCLELMKLGLPSITEQGTESAQPPVRPRKNVETSKEPC